MKCEHCSKDHDGSYGSGRFCCQACARSFSTKNNRKEIRQLGWYENNKENINRYLNKQYPFI